MSLFTLANNSELNVPDTASPHMVPTGPGNREKSGNLTWVPPGPGKVRVFINTCSNPGKVRDFKVS